MLKIIFSFFLIVFFSFSFAYEPSETYYAEKSPKPLQNLEVKERLGETIDTNIVFRDELSKEVQLQSYFNKPVLLTIVYFNCPSLCGFHLTALFDGLKDLSLQAGKDYEFVIVSMDDKETSSLAKRKKTSYLKKYKHSSKGIHFLTGDKDSIQKLADQVGFAFRWDEETEQFAHPPVAYVLSKESRISRYLYGVLFDTKTLKMALVEASEGRIGDIIDRVLLFCYRFNPAQNKYTLYAYNIMRLGGLLTILLLLAFLVPFWLKQKGKS